MEVQGIPIDEVFLEVVISSHEGDGGVGSILHDIRGEDLGPVGANFSDVGMGMGAYESMKTRGIRPVVTDIASIDEAVNAYISGDIKDLVDRLH